MRTLEDIQREYEIAKTEAEPLIKAMNKQLKKCNRLYNEIERYKIQHGMYHPMSDLLEHKGKTIENIELVMKNEDGTLKTKYMYNYEMFFIDENGRLDFYSFDTGIMRYDYRKEKYSYMYRGCETLYDFVGYLDVEFREDEEDEEEYA